MSEPSPESPFAEFARKKPSAVAYLRARQEQDRAARAESWLLLALLVGTSSSFAAAGAALAGGWMAGPLALALGVAGGVAGVLGGWLLGIVTWASIGTRRGVGPLAPVDPLANDLTRGNRWSRLAAWLTAWAALGIVVGVGLGASEGAVIATAFPSERCMLASWGGAAAGLAAGFVLYLVLRRLRPPSNDSTL